MRLASVLFVSIGFYGLLICVESALLITSPWQFPNRKGIKMIGSTSTPDLKASESNDEFSNVKCFLSVKIPSSDSLKSSSSSSKGSGTPRVFTPSAPIPIPKFKSKETKERTRLDSFTGSYDLVNNFEEASSDSSASSSSTSSSPELFVMSYEPEYAKILQIKKEEREKMKLAKKLKRKEEKLAKKRNSPTFGLYYTEDEEANLENFSRERYQRGRFEPKKFAELELNEENETDSDFGSHAPKGECYSLSF